MTGGHCTEAHLTPFSSLINPSKKSQELFKKYRANTRVDGDGALAAHICHRMGVWTTSLSVVHTGIQEDLPPATNEQGNVKTRELLICIGPNNPRCHGYIPNISNNSHLEDEKKD